MEPGRAPLWWRLYAMVWLLFAEFAVLLAFGSGAVPYWTHVALGVGVLALAWGNARALANSEAPARLKRVSAVTARLAGAQVVMGAALALDLNVSLGLSPLGIIGVLHLTAAFAMITQASSVATAYDMWEEREYESATTGVAAASQEAAQGISAA